MKYHKLPSKLKLTIVTILIIVVYGIIFYGMKTNFSELNPEKKIFLTQYGLMVIFISGLLVSIGTFWADKVRHNRELAKYDSMNAKMILKILCSLQKSSNIDLSLIINQNEEKLKTAGEKLDEVSKHPQFINYSVRLSLFVFAIGTIMCVVGAG